MVATVAVGVWDSQSPIFLVLSAVLGSLSVGVIPVLGLGVRSGVLEEEGGAEEGFRVLAERLTMRTGFWWSRSTPSCSSIRTPSATSTP